MNFWKSYVCSNKLDVPETNFSFAQFNRIRNHFLDAGLRLDGKPALELWDQIVTVLHGNTYQSNQERGNPCTNLLEVRAAPHKLQTRKKSHGMIDDLDNVDLIPQTSILLVRKLCCMCLRTPKQ